MKKNHVLITLLLSKFNVLSGLCFLFWLHDFSFFPRISNETILWLIDYLVVTFSDEQIKHEYFEKWEYKWFLLEKLPKY